MKKELHNQSDEELMCAYLKGNAMAFELLYKRHSPRIHGYIRKQIGANLASDALQETFMKLHNSRHLFNNDYPFLPWLFTITKNICTDFLRREGRRIETTALNEELTYSFSTNGDTSDFSEAAIKKLPSIAQQQAIQLRYFEDWSFEEIAKSLQTTPANSRKLVSRGLKQLKDIFTTHGGDDETN